MRRVRMNYRCPTCGTEVRITRAASEDPEPPRHCMDEMEYVPGEDD
jgi:DNA-directed RNA polymerase subunit RPC12/RpoP